MQKLGYNPLHERYSCILINGAHFHTVSALLVPAHLSLISFSASKVCRIGKPLQMVNTYKPEENHFQALGTWRPLTQKVTAVTLRFWNIYMYVNLFNHLFSFFYRSTFLLGHIHFSPVLIHSTFFLFCCLSDAFWEIQQAKAVHFLSFRFPSPTVVKKLTYWTVIFCRFLPFDLLR